MRTAVLLFAVVLLACTSGTDTPKDSSPSPPNGDYLDIEDLGIETNLLASCVPTAGKGAQCSEYYGVESDFTSSRLTGLRSCHPNQVPPPRCELKDSFLGVCVVDSPEGLAQRGLSLPPSSTWVMYRFREVVFTFPDGRQNWENEENSAQVCTLALGRWIPAADTIKL